MIRRAYANELEAIADRLAQVSILTTDLEHANPEFGAARILNALKRSQVWVDYWHDDIQRVVYIDETRPSVGQVHAFWFNGYPRRAIIKTALFESNYVRVIGYVPEFAAPIADWLIRKIGFTDVGTPSSTWWRGQKWPVYELLWIQE